MRANSCIQENWRVCSFTIVQLAGLDHTAHFCISPIDSSLGTLCIHNSECTSSVVNVQLKRRFGVGYVPLPIPLGIPPEKDGSI
jgi:hypothetical protein